LNCARQAATEMLSFQHLDIEVTTPRAGVFRQAICDLLQQEIGANLSTQVRNLGWPVEPSHF